MTVEGVRRPAWAEISSGAIAHNVRVVKEILGDTLLCAVIKANGYGHGAQQSASAVLAGGADSLAVAIVDEGIELRQGGITAPILLLAEVPADTITDGWFDRGGEVDRRDRRRFGRSPQGAPEGRYRHAPYGGGPE